MMTRGRGMHVMTVEDIASHDMMVRSIMRRWIESHTISIDKTNMQQLITLLKQLLATNPKDRYIKGHAKDLLTRLQALNPQDDN